MAIGAKSRQGQAGRTAGNAVFADCALRLSAFLFVIFLSSCRAGWHLEEGRVVRAVDGDTLIIELAGGKQDKVRLLGFNAPELARGKKPAEPGADAALAAARLTEGQMVILRTKGARDRYDRLLAEVFVTFSFFEQGRGR